MKNNLESKCIEDFGEQWNYFTDNKNYYASKDLFIDICGPDFPLILIQNANVVDVGAGTGRLTKILLDLGAKHIWCVEPSSAMQVLQKNTVDFETSLTYINSKGNDFVINDSIDLVFSIGVIHHIENADLTMKNIYKNLKIGGKVVIWLYGQEGNLLYLLLITPLRLLTKIIPHKLLLKFSRLLVKPLIVYSYLCKKFNWLPLSTYIINHLSKLEKEEIQLTIYDQLNPAYSKYYTKAQALRLLKNAGFINISIYHRHGYSWTVVGDK